MLSGAPEPLGATAVDGGVNFALFSSCAQRVELCLFEGDTEVARHQLPEQTGAVWHGFLPAIMPGQQYGYRVHGPWDPASGQRCNPAKLLIDPYARLTRGEFVWSPAVFAYKNADSEQVPNKLDSAPYVPRCVVTAPGTNAPHLPAQGNLASDSVIYEANLRGLTMRHPALSEAERGRFAGLGSAAVIGHLKALGITTVELMPVHDFIDESHLAERGLANLWGYNSISFLAPARRYLGPGGLASIRATNDALHDAGLEVILDVVYNHTGEGSQLGPTLGFRGIDNSVYYRLNPHDPGQYLNYTGCGNTVNTAHPQVQQLVLDSLRYWTTEMGFDGFRFDLAPAVARGSEHFDPHHPLLQAIASDPILGRVKCIAEPWDVGPDGYRLGQFPAGWAEWNDRYRDDVRRFWTGEKGRAPDLARRLHGSADVFEHSGRPPQASINFVTAHDGFTLADLVSYHHRNNLANGEQNRDGHGANFSRNFGVEGPTDDPRILALRRRQRLNILATLLLSQGTPMLLAGDEMGNSQGGNNNAYAQDNDTGWVDWSGLNEDHGFLRQVWRLIGLRKRYRVLRQTSYPHDPESLQWLAAGGKPMTEAQWHSDNGLVKVLHDALYKVQLAVVINGGDEDRVFRIPRPLNRAGIWSVAFSSGQTSAAPKAGDWQVQALSVALLIADRPS